MSFLINFFLMQCDFMIFLGSQLPGYLSLASGIHLPSKLQCLLRVDLSPHSCNTHTNRADLAAQSQAGNQLAYWSFKVNKDRSSSDLQLGDASALFCQFGSRIFRGWETSQGLLTAQKGKARFCHCPWQYSRFSIVSFYAYFRQILL